MDDSKLFEIISKDVVTRLGTRPMNDIDVDVYNSRKEFITGNSKSFNDLEYFFKDIDGHKKAQLVEVSY